MTLTFLWALASLCWESCSSSSGFTGIGGIDVGGLAFDLYKHQCPVCGKKFEGGMNWAYKERYFKNRNEAFRFFCSWKCLQEHRKGAK